MTIKEELKELESMLDELDGFRPEIKAVIGKHGLFRPKKYLTEEDMWDDSLLKWRAYDAVKSDISLLCEDAKEFESICGYVQKGLNL